MGRICTYVQSKIFPDLQSLTKKHGSAEIHADPCTIIILKLYNKKEHIQ